LSAALPCASAKTAIGSEEKPAPSGTLKVTGVKKNPTYHYNPAYAFKGVRTDKPLFTSRQLGTMHLIDAFE
jgi:hypothetical protein